jgi:hypothetical protein
MFDTGTDGDSLDGPDRGPGDAPIALGSGRARLRRRGGGRARDRAAARADGDAARARWQPCPAGRFGSRAVDRVRRARCHPRAGRRATRHGRGDARRRIERSDHAGVAARGRGAGGRLDRGLAGPDRDARPGRGGRAWDPAGMAGRPDPGRSRGGPRDRGLAPGGPRGGPARDRPAGSIAGEAPNRSGESLDRRSGESPGRWQLGGEIRRSTRAACRARASGRHHPRRARAADGREWFRAGRARRVVERRRRGDRDPARAGPSIVDPPRAGCRRPANGGDGRAQSRRATRPASDPPNPVRGRRRARRLPPP